MQKALRLWAETKRVELRDFELQMETIQRRLEQVKEKMVATEPQGMRLFHFSGNIEYSADPPKSEGEAGCDRAAR